MKDLDWLDKPKRDTWGMFYFKVQFFSALSAFFVAAIETYFAPLFKLGSIELVTAEGYYLLVFSIDFSLRMGSKRWKTSTDRAFLLLDAVTLCASLYVVLHWFGMAPETNSYLLAFIQLLRVMRCAKTLRDRQTLAEAFGKNSITEAIPYSIYGSILALTCAMLQKAIPEIGEQFPLAIMGIAAGGLFSLGGFVMGSAFGFTFSKSLNLADLVAAVYGGARALADDPEEVGGTPSKGKRSPIEIEGVVKDFVSGGKTTADEAEVAGDNWGTGLFRGLKKESDFQTDQAALSIFMLRLDTFVGNIWRMCAVANHRLVDEFYRVMYFIIWSIFGVLVFPFTKTLGGLIAVILIVTVGAILILALKDCDRPTDQARNIFNPDMPEPLAEHPTRPES